MAGSLHRASGAPLLGMQPGLGSRLLLRPFHALPAPSPAYALYRARTPGRMPLPAHVFSSDNESALLSSFSSLDSLDEDQFGPQGALTSEPAAALAPSDELRALCHLQLGMLVTALDARRLEETAAAGVEMAVRCAVYRRSPASLPSGQLQLQLVATTDVRQAEAASRRQDLILGIPQAAEQEAWLVDQSLIVLPDSGGLVLPLAHNSFLVGMMVVECCPEDAPLGSLAGSLHPPACAMFSPGDMAVIKQTGTALGLACALDLRAALERAGHALRRREVQGLVRQARKPLSTLRTLGAMLAPRLAEGEPERDMTESMLAQGRRLGDIVSQLQAFLAPAMPAVKIGASQAPPPPAFADFGTIASTARPPPLAAEAPAPAEASPHPALPSSTIGGDFWSPGTPPPARRSIDERVPMSSATTTAAAPPPAPAPATSLPAAPLVATLTPLLNSAENFAAVSGVTYLYPSSDANGSNSSTDGSGTARRPVFPETLIPVEPLVLKRMLSQLLDGAIACAARGDCIELAVEPEVYQGQRGVLVAARLLQAIGPGTLTRGAPAVLDAEGHVFVAEFATLARLARQAGGWFDAKIEAAAPAAAMAAAAGFDAYSIDQTPENQGLRAVGGGGALMAAMWLPAAAPDATLN